MVTINEPDSRPLPEDVTGHCMLGTVEHGDGRTCSYHHRLGVWTFGGVNECLRGHPTPESLMRRPS